MPGERKPSFAVVSGVVVCLALFGGLTRLLEPAIPPIQANAMARESSEFLKQGSAQRIEWQSVTSQPFATARSKNLPIMLIIGVPWSKFGRDLDRFVFTSNDVAAFLARNFVCVRVDAAEQPEWLNTFLPVSRGRLGFLSGLQIWFLDPRGKMFAVLVREGGNTQVDPQIFLDTLVRVRQRYEGEALGPGEADPAAMQITDLADLRTPATDGLPDLATHGRVLQQLTDEKFSGFPVRGLQRLLPNAWLFQIFTGDWGALGTSLDPILKTGIVDHLDGGFFRLAATADWNRLEFDKVAVQQAEMMRLLALSGATRGNAYHTWLAKRAFDSLAGEFIEDGYVRACRVGDEVRLGRSHRSSFSPRILRDLNRSGKLSDEGLQYTRDTLGLRVETNQPMVVRLSSPDEVDTPEFERVLSVLRGYANETAPLFTGEAMLDVNGFVAARMIECARLWKDEARMRRALDLSDGLEIFRADDDVRHSVAPGRNDYVYLGDYLGYADARLHDYLATGRASSFRNGLRVLRRAMVLFKTESPGVYNSSLGDTSGHPSVPEIVDNFSESLSARMIRLQDLYGRLMINLKDGKPSPTSVLLSSAANAGAIKLSYAAQEVQIGASGYFCAVLGLANQAHAIAIGPDASLLADALYRRLPTRFIAPAQDQVRPDLQKRQPGIYIVEGISVQGPMTVGQAAASLGLSLRAN